MPRSRRRLVPFATLIAVVALVALVPAAAADDDEPTLPPALAEACRARFFADLEGEALARALRQRVRVMRPDDALRRHVAAFGWEKAQLQRFASNKVFALVRTFEGTSRTLVLRGDRVRIDRAISEPQRRVIERLYGAERFERDDALPPVLAEPVADPAAALDAAAAVAARAGPLAPKEGVLGRARTVIATEDGARLAPALVAVGDDALAAALLIQTLARLDRGFRFRDGRVIPDAKIATARLLYENAVVTARSCREMPWMREVSPAELVGHILPLRGTEEPLQRWRAHFHRALAPEVRELHSLAAVVRFTNTLSAAIYGFEAKTTWEDQGPLTALFTHEGRCEDMVNLTAALLRSVGVPAEHVYTPWWARQDGNHAWCGIFAPGDRMLSIMGCEPSSKPPYFRRYIGGVTAAKIYVRTGHGPRDVTARFGPTADLVVEGLRPGQGVFLNVWNSGGWRSVGQVRVSADGRASFGPVGRREDIVLLVSSGRGDDPAALKPAAPPIVVHADGSIERLEDAETPDESWTRDVVLDGLEPGAETVITAWTAKGWRESARAKADDEGRATVRLARGHLYRRDGGRPLRAVVDGDAVEIVGY